MTDQNQILSISCPLFQLNASAIDYCRKCHPSKIVEKKKMQIRRKKKGTSQGGSHNKSTENAFTAAMSMPEAYTL